MKNNLQYKRLQKFIKSIQPDVNLYKNFSVRKKTYIDDVIYLLGVSIDNKYRFANGYEEFKKYLVKNILKQK